VHPVQETLRGPQTAHDQWHKTNAPASMPDYYARPSAGPKRRHTSLRVTGHRIEKKRLPVNTNIGIFLKNFFRRFSSTNGTKSTNIFYPQINNCTFQEFSMWKLRKIRVLLMAFSLYLSLLFEQSSVK